MIVATVVAVTAVVVNGTDPDHNPAGTVIVGGTITAGELLERLTTAPPAGAGPGRSTQAAAGVPPLSAGGVDRDVLQRRRQHGELARGRDAVERGGDRHGRRGRDLAERDLEIAPAEARPS